MPQSIRTLSHTWLSQVAQQGERVQEGCSRACVPSAPPSEEGSDHWQCARTAVSYKPRRQYFMTAGQTLVLAIGTASVHRYWLHDHRSVSCRHWGALGTCKGPDKLTSLSLADVDFLAQKGELGSGTCSCGPLQVSQQVLPALLHVAESYIPGNNAV